MNQEMMRRRDELIEDATGKLGKPDRRGECVCIPVNDERRRLAVT
jgi:hypothetical protein